ncbi:hypothetical protein NIES37_23240 [Tolypothrix tenuis PCC 7101]|uniref:Uncharacterized protein n=1 Tax=Tolypothrix tenuis PCC 7101 TaxID=231146 RepID=A0A1Z4MY17_9CYAN|nr:hypothetical protein NIES37_23240 [Tolypothrix tenuis PCC 7101]BAZ77707.1 hypothetical protein NIES50_63380 [Aulosira laxa NIES-50]
MFATDKFHVGARHPQSFGISNILQVPCPHPSVAFFFQNGITVAVPSIILLMCRQHYLFDIISPACHYQQPKRSEHN